MVLDAFLQYLRRNSHMHTS